MGSPPFRLRLLGSPRVDSAEGEPIDISVGKPLALLAFVALADEPVSREALARLLWPGASNKRARGSLRQALWQLRRRLGDGVFAGDDPVSLHDGAVECDLALVRDHLAASRLDDALSAWEGPPLSGLQVPDAPEWDRWADGLRDELEERFASALADAARRKRNEGDGEGAIEHLRAARRIQPGRLVRHLDLGEIHLERREFALATDAIEEARRHFEDPSALEELDELEARVHALRRSAHPDLDPPAGSLRLRFTGRTDEFAALVRGWRRAREGPAEVALVTGDAGVGKTRLGEEVALLAKSEGGRVVQVKAEDSERPIEWGLLGELVDRLLQLSGAAGISAGSTEVLRTVVPSIPQGTPTGVGTASREYMRTRPSAALADAFQDLMAAVADDAPLLVIVDDLQWADAESRAVLTRVATRSVPAPVLFLTISRTGAGDVSPRMRKTLQLLSESAGSMALELEPLSRDETRELIRETLTIPDHPESERIVERLLRASRGNPLFIAELLKVLQDRGIITSGGKGRWRLRPERVPADLPLPASLRELIDRQLLNLPQEAALVAAHMAHSRHSVPARVLALQARLSQEALTRGVGELVQRRMVRWEEGDRLSFAHDELRAAVARRFQLHVGLTTGGGAHWSLFRSAVVASLVLLLASAAAYVLSGGTFRSAPPLGGGPLLVVLGPDSVLEARAPITSPVSGWTIAPASDSAVEALAQTGSVQPVAEDQGFVPPSRSEAAGVAGAALASAGDIRVFGVAAGPQGGAHARVLRPDESLVDARTWERVQGAAWCGGTPPKLLLTVVDDGDARLLLWDPDGAQVSELPLRGVPGGIVACSPDGRYGAILAAEDGESQVRLLDLQTRESVRIPVPDPFGVQALRWDADRPAPVPVSVVLDGPASRVLDWGEQTALDARIAYSDGSASRAALVWRSRDPGVASVTPEGHLTANRPGVTTIEVSFDGWLADSLRLRVRETGNNPRILLWDRVPPLGDELWEPIPGLSEFAVHGPDGDHALPGRTWRSTEGFALPAGGTLELEFSLLGPGEPLTVCLVRFPATAADARVCLELRDANGAGGDAHLHYHPSFAPVTFAVPPSSPTGSGRWRHAGIALLPDGTGVAYLDGSEVARTPLRLPLQLEGEWHVILGGVQPIIEGAAPERAFRNVLLWPDVRF